MFLEQYLQEATERFETLRVFMGDFRPVRPSEGV